MLFTSSREVPKATKAAAIVVVFALAVLCIATVSTTRASNFGSAGSVGTSGTTNGVFLADNWIHNVVRRQLSSGYTDGITLTVGYDYDPHTDLEANTWEDTQCVDSGMDVCVFDDNYGNVGLDGWVACVSGTQSGSHPNMICSLSWLRINTFASPSAGEVTCHELGHTVGLRHTTNSASCLQNPFVTGAQYLSSHDISHINAHY